MKKVFNSCSGAVLFDNLFTMHLHKGLVDCISFIKVSLGLFGLLLLVVSLSEFVSLDCSFSISLSVGVFLIPLLVVTALTMFIHVGFVPFGFFWCFLGSSTSHERQSAALFLAPEIHSNVMLYEVSSSPHLLIFVFSFVPFKNRAKGSLSVGIFLVLVVTALTMFIHVGFVPFGFFWCFLGSSTSHERQSAALFLAPEIH